MASRGVTWLLYGGMALITALLCCVIVAWGAWKYDWRMRRELAGAADRPAAGERSVASSYAYFTEDLEEFLRALRELPGARRVRDGQRLAWTRVQLALVPWAASAGAAGGHAAVRFTRPARADGRLLQPPSPPLP